MMRHIALIFCLAVRFFRAGLSAGLATAWVIVSRHDTRAGLIRMEFAPMSNAGAMLLGALITLTPGSSAVDIDLAERVMLIHLLDGRDPCAAIAAIRRDFEHYIVNLFPSEAAT